MANVVSSFSFVDPSKVGTSAHAQPDGQGERLVERNVRRVGGGGDGRPPPVNPFREASANTPPPPYPDSPASAPAASAAQAPPPAYNVAFDRAPPTSAPATSARGTAPLSPRSPVFGAGLLAFITVLMCACMYAFSTAEADVSITALRWERTIALEELQEVAGAGWAVPAGARVTSSEQRTRSTHRVLARYETRCERTTRTEAREEYVRTDTVCYDDGACVQKDVMRHVEEQVPSERCAEVPVEVDAPLYEPYYFYMLPTWVRVAPLVTRGGSGERPHWPLGPGTGSGRRTAGESQLNEVIVTEAASGKSWSHALSEAELVSLRVGMRARIAYNSFGVTKFEIIAL